jgi:hypothetical protein
VRRGIEIEVETSLPPPFCFPTLGSKGEVQVLGVLNEEEGGGAAAEDRNASE